MGGLVYAVEELSSQHLNSFKTSLSAGACIDNYLTTFLAEPNVYLLTMVGMVSFLTAVSRTPFTSFILIVEMTDSHKAIFPLMLAALCAYQVARLLSPCGIYEHMKDQYLKSA